MPKTALKKKCLLIILPSAKRASREKKIHDAGNVTLRNSSASFVRLNVLRFAGTAHARRSWRLCVSVRSMELREPPAIQQLGKFSAFSQSFGVNTSSEFIDGSARAFGRVHGGGSGPFRRHDYADQAPSVQSQIRTGVSTNAESSDGMMLLVDFRFAHVVGILNVLREKYIDRFPNGAILFLVHYIFV